MKCELLEIDGLDLNEEVFNGFLNAIEKAHKDLAILHNLNDNDE